MKNDLVRLCRPTISKNGKYALIPCVTKEGKFYTAIVELSERGHSYVECGQLVIRFDLKEIKR